MSGLETVEEEEQKKVLLERREKQKEEEDAKKEMDGRDTVSEDDDWGRPRETEKAAGWANEMRWERYQQICGSLPRPLMYLWSAPRPLPRCHPIGSQGPHSNILCSQPPDMSQLELIYSEGDAGPYWPPSKD
ncbi:hypothetical protein FDECE_9675 [Fusarium decemcellulare]|nr:hypothetical protein FDECE_9675 [Fusarium decemcellulare]